MSLSNYIKNYELLIVFVSIYKLDFVRLIVLSVSALSVLALANGVNGSRLLNFGIILLFIQLWANHHLRCSMAIHLVSWEYPISSSATYLIWSSGLLPGVLLSIDQVAVAEGSATH